MRLAAAAALLCAGCWDGERSSLPFSEVAFTPQAGGPDAWLVTAIEVGLTCPDDRPARTYVVHPAQPLGPLPSVVLFHQGAFDFVPDAPFGDPLGGTAFQPVRRVELPWAVRDVFATLGMVPEPTGRLEPTGALVAALADAGVVTVLPINCWGDVWHNRPGTRENAYFGDQFLRAGGSQAEWAWRLVTQPGFDQQIGVTLPYLPNPARAAMVGLGSGGRAVGELLVGGASPRAVVIEGHEDDVQAWRAARPDEALGLDRIFAFGRDPMLGAFSSAPTLPPTLWVYSSADPALAAGSQELALDRLAGAPDSQVIDRQDTRHLQINADPALAEQAAGFLVDRL